MLEEPEQMQSQSGSQITLISPLLEQNATSSPNPSLIEPQSSEIFGLSPISQIQTSAAQFSPLVNAGPSFELQSLGAHPGPTATQATLQPTSRLHTAGRRRRAPLVEIEVRCSPRIRGTQDGYKHVHLGKRQRREVALLSIPA